MHWIAVLAVLRFVSAVDKCSVGTYRHSKSPWRDGCPGFRICEKGHYCDGDIKKACPPGVYGDKEGLTTSSCSGHCPPGYFCPAGTEFPTAHKCGNASSYCPAESARPATIPSGYYGLGESIETYSTIAICPKGHYCRGGEKFTCPAGRYGNQIGMQNEDCAGICPGGWYCPVGTIEPTDHPCGSSPRSYCPAGSSHPVSTAVGFYAVQSMQALGGGYEAQARCPPGNYCTQGECHPCPAGRYGTIHESINASCDGECYAGW